MAEEQKTEGETIICDSCEWYILKGKKPKCKYVNEKDRLAMLKSGFDCPEYQRAHRLQV